MPGRGDRAARTRIPHEPIAALGDLHGPCADRDARALPKRRGIIEPLASWLPLSSPDWLIYTPMSSFQMSGWAAIKSFIS
jgi:hypothetical protein